MDDLSDWLTAFYAGTPTGQPIQTTASILTDALTSQAASPAKARTPTWMPMSITPGSTNPAPGVMGADGEVAPTGGPMGLPDIGEFFGRAVVIILGFIFVAAGLSMFREPLAQLTK